MKHQEVLILVLCALQLSAVLGATCEYDGKEYEEGKSFPSNDGCNTCYCEGNGFVSCTEGCLPGGTNPDNCFYNGQTYKTGDGFLDKDGCNRCTCERDQKVACTKKACVPQKAKCKDSDGLEHLEGASIPAEDGCNSCVCTKKGMFICTLQKCEQKSAKTPNLKSRRRENHQEKPTNSALLCNVVNYGLGAATLLVYFALKL